MLIICINRLINVVDNGHQYCQCIVIDVDMCSIYDLYLHNIVHSPPSMALLSPNPIFFSRNHKQKDPKRKDEHRSIENWALNELKSIVIWWEREESHKVWERRFMGGWWPKWEICGADGIWGSECCGLPHRNGAGWPSDRVREKRDWDRERNEGNSGKWED